MENTDFCVVGCWAGLNFLGVFLDFFRGRDATISRSHPFPPGGVGRPLSPRAPPTAGSRSGVGQMPESGDESQGIAVKGLLCPLRYPGSDLSRLRMITFFGESAAECEYAANFTEGVKPILSYYDFSETTNRYVSYCDRVLADSRP